MNLALHVGTTAILARVGVSFISTAQACSNAEEEIPDFDFDGVQSEARAQWNEILGRVQVGTEGVDNEIVELLYSSLYRIHIVPADCELAPVIVDLVLTRLNPHHRHRRESVMELHGALLRLFLLQCACSVFPSVLRGFREYGGTQLCLPTQWDTYRTLYSLMALHDPVNFARIVRGLINIQQHEGAQQEHLLYRVMDFISDLMQAGSRNAEALRPSNSFKAVVVSCFASCFRVTVVLRDK